MEDFFSGRICEIEETLALVTHIPAFRGDTAEPMFAARTGPTLSDGGPRRVQMRL